MKYPALFVLFLATVFSQSTTLNAQMLFEETFDKPTDKGLYNKLKSHRYLSIEQTQGTDQSPALKAQYKSSERGSERIVVRYPLGERGMEYTLCMDVKFDKDFQFVKGGKLHGLGPDRPITGGNAMKPTGWSARMMFHRDEQIQTYIYCQNKPGKYGITKKNHAFKFVNDQYYAISYHVRVNDLGKDNGFAHIYIDGKLIIEHNGLEFRGSDDPSTLISQFMFSTFHGGHKPEWAPKDEQGHYKDVYAYYDNISVWRNKHIKDKPGTITQSH